MAPRNRPGPIVGVPDTIVDAMMGGGPGISARTRRRYRYLTNGVLTDPADKIGGLPRPLPRGAVRR